jgi:hypothetical protein
MLLFCSTSFRPAANESNLTFLSKTIRRLTELQPLSNHSRPSYSNYFRSGSPPRLEGRSPNAGLECTRCRLSQK